MHLGAVKHVSVPQFPNLRFEYHPDSKKVFVVTSKARTLGDLSPDQGGSIADNVSDDGQAQSAVQTYLRGYRAGLVAGEVIAKGKVNGS